MSSHHPNTTYFLLINVNRTYLSALEFRFIFQLVFSLDCLLLIFSQLMIVFVIIVQARLSVLHRNYMWISNNCLIMYLIGSLGRFLMQQYEIGNLCDLVNVCKDEQTTIVLASFIRLYSVIFIVINICAIASERLIATILWEKYDGIRSVRIALLLIFGVHLIVAPLTLFMLFGIVDYVLVCLLLFLFSSMGSTVFSFVMISYRRRARRLVVFDIKDYSLGAKFQLTEMGYVLRMVNVVTIFSGAAALVVISLYVIPAVLNMSYEYVALCRQFSELVVSASLCTGPLVAAATCPPMANEMKKVMRGGKPPKRPNNLPVLRLHMGASQQEYFKHLDNQWK